jgi:hypothetical protein
VAGSQSSNEQGIPSNLNLIRYTAQGSLDQSITTNPTVLSNVTVNDAVAGPNGTVLLAGASTETDGVTAAFLARYLSADGVSPAFNQPVLKPSVVAGEPFNARLPLVLTNIGPELSGSFNITYYANTTDTIDGGQILLTSLTRNLTLKTGQHAAITTVIRSLPASLPAGSYYILAEVTDPSGAVNIAATSATVAVTAPVASLSATV